VVIPNMRKVTLLPIIHATIQPESVVHTDSYRACDVPDISEFRHVRINHTKRFIDGQRHINGIGNVWNPAKRHLRRYNGIPRQSASEEASPPCPGRQWR